MIESCPDGLALLDGSGIILEHNTAMATILGEPSGLLIDDSLTDRIQQLRRDPGLDPVLESSVLERAVALPETLLVEFKQFVVEFRLSGWIDAGGAFYVVAARPMDTRDAQARELVHARQHIQILDAALREQRQSDETARLDALSMLASTMVHDLNNALAVVLANMHLLREHVGHGDHEELIDDACAGTERVQELVSRLRSFSTGPSLVLGDLCLTTWLPAFLRPIVASYRGTLHLELDADNLWVSADENQISQVILNLIMNSVQAAAEAGLYPEVTVRLESSPHGYISGRVVRPVTTTSLPHAVITIEDNGQGIPDDAFGTLFTPFETTKPKGSGLGLPSVARITELHRGGIAIDNLQSGGARISVALPLVPVCSSNAASGTPTPREVPVLRPLKGASLIIMDDDPRVRKGLRRILEAENARVTETSCGEEFLAAYAEQRHAGCTPLGILDVHIASGMGGLETISRLHAQWPDAVVMACTGHAEIVSTEEFSTMGFHDWILKPFKPTELRTALERLCEMLQKESSPTD